MGQLLSVVKNTSSTEEPYSTTPESCVLQSKNNNIVLEEPERHKTYKDDIEQLPHIDDDYMLYDYDSN